MLERARNGVGEFFVERLILQLGPQILDEFYGPLDVDDNGEGI